MKKTLLSFLLPLVCLFTANAQDCIIPSTDFTTTDNNMTLMVTSGALASLPNESGEAVLLSMVSGGEVVAYSMPLSGAQGGNLGTSVMGDDPSTAGVTDGAVVGETVSFQLIDGTSLYDVILTPPVVYAANAIHVVFSASVSLNCSVNLVLFFGCIDPLYVEYDASATTDDGSCVTLIVAGCTNSLYVEYNANANTDDGSCATLIVAGCTDNSATNYDVTATEDDGSCTYDDGEEGDCEIPSTSFTTTDNNMTIMVTSGAFNSLPNESGEAILISLANDDVVAYSIPLSGVQGGNLGTAVMGDDSGTPEVEGAQSGESVTFQLIDGNSLYDVTFTPPVVYTANAIHVVFAASVSLNCTGEEQTIISGCIDPDACNYIALATDDDGSCIYANIGYDCDGLCLNDADSDGVCDEDEVLGCTDVIASNYDASATDDDGSCEYESTGDCTLPAGFVGNTGANMTVLLTPAFIQSLNVETTNAYLVAIATNQLVVGSVGVSEGDLIGGQASLPVWGDDSTTPEVDGAVSAELISFQLVDGTSLYDIAITVSFVANGISVQTVPTTTTFVCAGEVAVIAGCTDDDACNYNELANEEDGSCSYPQGNYDCNGNCLNDADNDGVCDEDEVLGCTDSEALNYNPIATDDNATCEYPVTVYGCTNPNATNFNDEATDDDGSCVYGDAGCTYEEANNYNSGASYDDGSCSFDDTFIYIYNPIDGQAITTNNIQLEYEVQNYAIGNPVQVPAGGHIRYSIDGSSLINTFNGSGTIDLELENGEHTVVFTLYLNSPYGTLSSPLIESSVTFMVGEEGCMDVTAGNYNVEAVIDNGTCIPSVDVDFDEANTGANHTILILATEIDLNGLALSEGDLIGVFYMDTDGVLQCAGYTSWSPGQLNQVVAWGDDTQTNEQDGFSTGQEFIWIAQITSSGNSVMLQATYNAAGQELYETNSISQVVTFDSNITVIEGCMDSDYLEYNPIATQDDGSCITLKVEGCTDSSFIEYWDYNTITLVITEPVIPANFDDGSCQTQILAGCTEDNYLEYCAVCNVYDGSCEQLVIMGCTDPLALNYNEYANTDDSSCEYDLCISFGMSNFEILTSSTLNVPVLAYDVTNMSSEVLVSSTLAIEFDEGSYVSVSNVSVPSTNSISPGDLMHVELTLTNSLLGIPDYIFLNGQITLTGITGSGYTLDCTLGFEEIYLQTTHIGCTNENAYNYDENATVEDGSCVDNLNVFNITEVPQCYGDYGTITLYITGGVPPYYSSTEFTVYSELGVPSLATMIFDDFGVGELTGFMDDNYTLDIHDSSEITTVFEFEVEQPEELIIAIDQQGAYLTADVIEGDAIMYQWLYNGVALEGASFEYHYAQNIGEYQVYFEDANGCHAYSEPVTVSYIGLEELTDNQINIYPNPAKDVLHVELPEQDEQVIIRIMDILGQELISITAEQVQSALKAEFNITELPNGLYFVNVTSKQEQIVKRFIKN